MSEEPQKRKGKSSTLHIDLPSNSLTSAAERPVVSALFLVTFDVKAGYTISWQRSVAGLEISDSVEFKSLPSGLHNVEEDLVYFVHEDRYAGISAFVNKTAAKHERGVLMLAVGALIPLEHGRLGRAWRHADGLKELANLLVTDIQKTDLLEAYWSKNQPQDEPAEETGTGAAAAKPSKTRDQMERPSLEDSAQAQAKSLMPGPTHELSLFHPARSTPAMVEMFGPLMYPLYKAALLRKRILLVAEAPVELSCNFVYNISILSNIPASLVNLVPLDPLPARLQPLFSVGVHDIDALSARSKDASKNGQASQLSEGWVACTTDDVLAQKKGLFDIAVTVPQAHSDKAASKAWPKIKTSSGADIKANHRDVRRFRNLRKGLDRREASTTRSLAGDTGDDTTDGDETASATDDDRPLLERSKSRQTLRTTDTTDVEIDESLVEPVTWTAAAYNSFLWWASAGERGAELEEETTHDQSMFQAFEPYSDAPTSGRPASLRSSGLMTDGSPSAPEMAVIAYFHRLTTSILQVLANLVDDSEEDEEQERRDRLGGARPAVVIEGEDLVRMGLDPWSESDRVFVAQLLDFYWGRKADVRGGRIECCGLRFG